MFGKKKSPEDDQHTKTEAKNQADADTAAEDTDTGSGNSDSQESVREEVETDRTENDDQKYGELHDKYLRLYSDFENFRRRTQRERIELIGSANRDLLISILPVFDDFERGMGALDKGESIESAIEGFKLIFQKFKTTLRSAGLKEIEAVGQPFDAEMHDAITKIPSPSEDMIGKVIDEIQKGYMLNDKIIRHAKVVVGE